MCGGISAGVYFFGSFAGCVIVFFQSYGYGVQDSFTEDPLFLSDVTAAMAWLWIKPWSRTAIPNTG